VNSHSLRTGGTSWLTVGGANRLRFRPRSTPRPNQEWALDFVSDALANGRALRALTMVDSFTRECPVIEVNTGISSRQVTRAPFIRVADYVVPKILNNAAASETARCGTMYPGGQ
jgi:transposase InsO family protein